MAIIEKEGVNVLLDMKVRKVMSITVLMLGVFFVGYGAYRGEVETVFSKAIRICLECVGIG